MHKQTNLTRKEIAEQLTEKLGYSQNICSELVDSFLGKLKDALIDGKSVKLVHFGTFTVRDKAPRTGRNPRTGEPITITKRQAVSFRPSKKLREQVNN